MTASAGMGAWSYPPSGGIMAPPMSAQAPSTGGGPQMSAGHAAGSPGGTMQSPAGSQGNGKPASPGGGIISPATSWGMHPASAIPCPMSPIASITGAGTSMPGGIIMSTAS